ncbi:MAG: MmcQ/YjbR family DNA-binding protein [Acidimicrobiales bacterium]
MSSMKDLDRIALALPEVVKELHDGDRPTYLVNRKLFCFHRVPRKDAVDDVTGERLNDVLAFRLADEEMKAMWLSDDRSIFFTTDHFNGHPWILLRIGDLSLVDSDELNELVSDAWLTRAPSRLAKSWLADHGE